MWKFVVVFQLLSHVQLLVTPWTTACQASLSFTISLSLFTLMSIESVMPSNHLVLYHPFLLLPLIFPSIKVFSNEFASSGQSIWASASASVLPKNIWDWLPLWLTGLISLQSKGLSKDFSNPQFKILGAKKSQLPQKTNRFNFVFLLKSHPQLLSQNYRKFLILLK